MLKSTVVKYKAICFDIDGTLYKIRMLFGHSLKTALFSPLLNLRYMNMRKKYREYQKDFDSHGLQNKTLEQREALIFSEITDGRVSVEKAEKQLRKRYYKKLERAFRKLQYQPEVVRTFEKIRSAGLKIGVFTDWPFFTKLEQIGVSDLVDFKATANEIGYLKPDKRCFEYLVNNIGVRPEEMLYVGDSYKKDIIGASDYGIDAVLVNANSSDYPIAKKVFAQWSEFDAWLSEIIDEEQL